MKKNNKDQNYFSEMNKNDKLQSNKTDDGVGVTKQTSMGTLIIWNISKALEKNPRIDLRGAIRSAQERLERDSRDVNQMISQFPEERHLACALLAWHQLGHSDADSLYTFFETKQIEANSSKKKVEKDDTLEETNSSNDRDTSILNSYTKMGPVLKLPVETKIIMRLENTPSARQPPKKSAGTGKDIMNKIDAACCMESGCVERLAELDAATKELRSRAAKLAKREAERVELLERAEAAWKDLELGYLRRLRLAEEKEDDMIKQTQKLIEERNGYKSACTSLALQLKERGDTAEQDRTKLVGVEKEVCDRACVRMRLSEEIARGDATLADHQCKAAQLDRDLQFKEEQARRKQLNLESAVESARALTHEAERALRSELGALKEQIAQVSNQLLEEDAENSRIKEELDNLQREKLEMVEDLDGCKIMCDNKMQGRLNELKKKKEQLNGLKDKAMECRCKLPVDATIEVKRTPSLAALCRCTPEDKVLDSCSCTSLRSRLLSNLLADLFGGLQQELGGSGSQMPCQLLKCLEDRHNWDRASIVKSNLRSFFAQLLIGELDIAIATSIEKYHAKWVGASCADVVKKSCVPNPEVDENEGWQERAIERRAQKLATQLAEQLFQEKAELLAKKAKEIASAGPPPCECKPQKATAAVYPCLVKTPPIRDNGPSAAIGSNYWRRTFQDVSQLKAQIEDLKRESIKKEDLKSMEEKLTKIIQFTSEPENIDAVVTKDLPNIEETCPKDNKKKNVNSTIKSYSYKGFIQNKKQSEITSNVKKGKNVISCSNQIEKANKFPKKLGQSFAVNLCLCGSQKKPKLPQNAKVVQNAILNDDGKQLLWTQKPSKVVPSQISNIKQAKPINTQYPSQEINIDGTKTQAQSQASCKENCVCFHKVPSNTSIDKLLETLAKWKCDLTQSIERNDTQLGSVKCNSNTAEKIKDQSSILKSDLKSDMGVVSVSTTRACGNDSDFCYSVSNQNDLIKSVDFDHELPLATESEYMAAINLDKSNDAFCNCNNVSQSKDNTLNTAERTTFKCIDSKECKCHKALGNKSSSDKIKFVLPNDVKPEKNNQYRNQAHDLQIIKRLQNLNTPSYTESVKQNLQDSNTTPVVNIGSDIGNVIKASELFPCNCDYKINFLGVTLTNLNSENNIGSSDVKNDPAISNSCKDRHRNNLRDVKKQKEKSQPIKNTTNSISRTFLPTCQCNVKFDEFKSYINNVFGKKNDNNSLNADKEIDTQSFRDNIIENIETCVCCQDTKNEESKDLEENTFQLLEEHLKGKLNELKQSCQSLNIPQEEEEKMFSTTLQRIKKVISESTKNITCKCPQQDQTKGSWNRAYSLLEEYLKTKIKRIQCLCTSTKDNNVPILPDVLDKVCNLIEDDFARLKDICTCKNIDEAGRKIIKFETPEKEFIQTDPDDCHDELNFLDNLKVNHDLCKQIYNQSFVLTETTSSQVPYNVGMENKSCEVVRKDSKNIQTIDTKGTTMDGKISNSIISANGCDCSIWTKEPVFFDSRNVVVNNCVDVLHRNESLSRESVMIGDNIHHKDKIRTENDIFNDTGFINQHFEESTTMPYIGYTVDCNCDSKLGSCVCIKSIIKENSFKISDTWKTLTTNKAYSVNMSYIMDNVSKPLSTKLSYNSISRVTKASNNTIACETKNSSYDEEDMVLKGSRENFIPINDTTNTFEENISSETDDIDTDTLNWYECRSTPCNQLLDKTDNLNSPLFYPMNRARSEKLKNKAIIKTLPRTVSENCECAMVPICHVKMLVENIEKKLINYQCTCDSLTSKVCPVHANKHFI